MPPLVSVIVPAYNYGRFISQALDSVLAQTFTDWECLIVDDGSTDDTCRVVHPYVAGTDRFRYLHQQNAGPAAARNTGINNSRGKYIQFLDADDLIQPDKLNRQVDFLQRNPHVDIVYSEMRYFRDEAPGQFFYSMSDPDLPWLPRVSGSGNDVLLPLLKSNIVVSNSPLMCASVIRVVGLFHEKLQAQEDWHYWLRCALRNRYFAFQDFENAFALVRLHPSSASQSGRRRITASTTYEMWRKTPMAALSPDAAKLHKNAVFQAGRDFVEEKRASGSLVGVLYEIISLGIKCRKYQWAAKEVERACRRRLWGRRNMSVE